MSECEKIIDYMRCHGSITKMEAYENRITTTLAQRVADLKHKKGYNIGSVMVKPANPSKSSYSKYFLVQ